MSCDGVAEKVLSLSTLGSVDQGENSVSLTCDLRKSLGQSLPHTEFVRRALRGCDLDVRSTVSSVDLVVAFQHGQNGHEETRYSMSGLRKESCRLPIVHMSRAVAKKGDRLCESGGGSWGKGSMTRDANLVRSSE